MKRAIIITIFVAFSTLVYVSAHAGIVWEGPYHTFRYGVEKNEGLFYYGLLSPPYFNSNQSEQVLHYDASQGQFSPYGGTALGEFVEFDSPDTIPGEIQVKAMARGPDGGVSPPNGLLVQAFAEIVPTDMTSNHGVQITQQVGSWVTRRFSVSLSGSYSIQAELSGQVDFYDFTTGFQHYKADHSLGGIVELLENPDDPAKIRTVAEFTLNASNRDQNVEVVLQTNAIYQLKVVINIASELTNFTLQGPSIAGAVPTPHNYSLGAEDSPLVVEAVVVDLAEDTDGDTVPDAIDNCPNAANLNQADSDGDNLGDVCDNCPNFANLDQTDSDGDGWGNACDGCPNDGNKIQPGVCGCGNPDMDSDGDSILNCNDAFPYNGAEWLDSDSDGIGNNADPDDDNDGMSDNWETQYGLDPVINDAYADRDGDGYSNLSEYLSGSDPTRADSVPQPPPRSVPGALLLLYDE